MIDPERIVKINEKRLQMNEFIESITRDNRQLIQKFKRAVNYCISLIEKEKKALQLIDENTTIDEDMKQLLRS